MNQRRGTRRIRALRKEMFDRKIAAYVEAMRRAPAPPPLMPYSIMDDLGRMALDGNHRERVGDDEPGEGEGEGDAR